MLEEKIIWMKENIKYVLLLFTILGFLLFIINPFNILHYFRIVLIIIILILFFLFILTTLNLYKQAITFLFFIVMVGFLFLCMYIVLLIFTLLAKNLFKQSFGIFFLYYIVIVSLIISITKVEVVSYSKINNITNLFYYIFIYIPCFLKDTIEYFVNDYKKTNNTTFILFLILILMILYMSFYNVFQSYVYNGGLLLLGDKQVLNKELISISLKDLKSGNIKETFSDMALIESKNAYNEITNYYNTIKNKIIQKPTVNLNIKQYENEPENLRNKLNEKINNSFFSKIYYLFNNEDTISKDLSPTLHVYHYGISFWIYLDVNIKDETTTKDIILTFGSNPTLYYDYSKQLLIVEFIDKHNNKIIYTTNKILYQRWNHIVLNYVNGTFDIIVNGVIVSTAKNIAPYINDNDMLIIGNDNNSSLCAITQFRYFKEHLSMGKIKNLYKYNNDLI